MPVQRGLQERGRQRCGRNHGLLSLSPAPPHGGKQCSPTQQGKAARRKKPQPGTVRVSPYKPPSLSLERTSQRHVGQVSWLAAFPYSLHLPEMRHLSGFCRFRSAHSCGAAMDLHHLPWSQPQTVTNPTSGVFNSMCELTAAHAALSRTFLQRSRRLYLSREAELEEAHHRGARLHDARPESPPWLVGGINSPADAVNARHAASHTIIPTDSMLCGCKSRDGTRSSL
jgi:hypothetical protein